MARRVWLDNSNRGRLPAPDGAATGKGPVVDRRPKSRDGLRVGVVERVESDGGRRHVVDYKTSLMVDEEAYALPIKLFAYMWFDRLGVWPDGGLLKLDALGRNGAFRFPVSQFAHLAQVLAGERLRTWIRVSRALSGGRPSRRPNGRRSNAYWN